MAVLFIFSIAVFKFSFSKGTVETSSVVNQNSQKLILLDPGHGGEDPGAVSDYSGIKEKDINLNVAKKVKELLINQKHKVLMTREEDKLEYSPETTNVVQKRKQDLQRRKKIMDEGGADLVVSIHLNKFPQTKYYGAQVFYPPNSQSSQILANCIQKSLREIVDNNNTREALQKKEPIIIFKNNKTTSSIVECGFLSNPEEEKLLATKDYQDKLASAIKEGILRYITESSR